MLAPCRFARSHTGTAGSRPRVPTGAPRRRRGGGGGGGAAPARAHVGERSGPERRGAGARGWLSPGGVPGSRGAGRVSRRRRPRAHEAGEGCPQLSSGCPRSRCRSRWTPSDPGREGHGAVGACLLQQTLLARCCDQARAERSFGEWARLGGLCLEAWVRSLDATILSPERPVRMGEEPTRVS